MKLAKMQSKLSYNIIEGDIKDPENQLKIQEIQGELTSYLKKNQNEGSSQKNFLKVNKEKVKMSNQMRR